MFDLSFVRKRLGGRGQRPATARKTRRARLALEALDSRVLLSVTSSFSAASGVLTVAGYDLDNTIVVSRDAAGAILVNGAPVAGVTVANTSRILLNGGAGNDVLTLDETNGGLPLATLDGGAGNDVLTGGAVADAPGTLLTGDTLLGGAGDDTINGGAGDDFINGGPGNDTLFGGTGNDRFSWSPGDGNDTVDGQAGNDLLGFFGGAGNDNIAVSANGTRARLTRDVDGVTMDLNSLEAVDVIPLGGADTVTVNDLTGTGVVVLNIALGADAFHDGDGQADTVILNGTNGNDNVAIVGSTAGSPSLNVVGLPAQVNITDSEPTDRLAVNTLGGFDRVNTAFLDAGVIGLTVDLGDGQGVGVTTTTALSTSTATAVFGQPVTLTATVTSAAGVPTGTVFFLDGDAVLGTAQVDASGQATLAPPLVVGNHALTASYVGTGNFANSASAAAAVTVSPAATTVALTSSANPAAAGQAVTFTATVAAVAPVAGVPTGMVTFKDGDVVLGVVPVSPFSGVAALRTTFAAAGGHAITAVYSGNATLLGSAQALTENVNAPAPDTTTTLRTSTAAAVFGHTETLTAAVTSPAGVPSGTVVFKDGNTQLGIAQVDANGQAMVAVSLGVGTHALTATFVSNAFPGSTSAAVGVTVSPASTAVALASSVNPAATGQAVTFTAAVTTVTPGSGRPTGTVTFKDGAVILGAVTVGADGTAKLTTSFAAAGGHAITAVYSGAPNFAGNSQALTEQVNAPTTTQATTTALLASANPAVVGHAVTFTATVRGPAGAGTPTGTVSFFVANTLVARVTLDANGQARLTGSFSGTGQFAIRAVYSGDPRFTSSSQLLTEQVNRS
jgi:hypothetical protein